MDRPEGTTPLAIDGVEVGAPADAWLERALEPPTPFVLEAGVLRLAAPIASFAGRSAALAGWADAARARWGVTGWRDERVVVRDPRDGRPLASIERALLRPLGLPLRSVLAVAWTRRADGPRIWVARRGWDRPVDPGRLDALVAGGIAGFDTPAATLERECAEEAGLPGAIARRARPAGELELCYLAVDDGLVVVHREHVLLHELELPPDLAPRAADGEHASIEPMRPHEALASIEAGGWTRDGAQATLDLLQRHGWRAPAADR